MLHLNHTQAFDSHVVLNHKAELKDTKNNVSSKASREKWSDTIGNLVIPEHPRLYLIELSLFYSLFFLHLRLFCFSCLLFRLLRLYNNITTTSRRIHNIPPMMAINHGLRTTSLTLDHVLLPPLLVWMILTSFPVPGARPPNRITPKRNYIISCDWFMESTGGKFEIST